MAGVFDLLGSINFRDLLMGAAAVPSINTLLTSKTPGTTPPQVDQFIAQSQQGLGDLRGFLNQFQSPEALSRRRSGAQSEITQKRALAQSGLGVQGSFDAAKLGAENNFRQAQRQIAQSFNRRGIRPGSNLAIEPQEQAAVDFSFRLADLEAQRDRELRGEQERLAELSRLESEIPEADFSRFIQPLLSAQLQAASPSKGAELAQSGRNAEILGASAEKQAAANTLGQLAMIMALSGKGGTGLGAGGGADDTSLAKIASSLGIPLSFLKDAISGTTPSFGSAAGDLSSGFGAADAAIDVGGAGPSLSASPSTVAGGIGTGAGGVGSTFAAQEALEAAAAAASFPATAATLGNTAAGFGAADAAIGAGSLGTLGAAGVIAAPAAIALAARAAAPYVQKGLNAINPSRLFGGGSRPTPQEAGDANVARITSEYGEVKELMGGSMPWTLEEFIQQTGGNPFTANDTLRGLLQQNRWRVDELSPTAERWGFGGGGGSD